MAGPNASRGDLLEKAERLARELSGQGVKRNEVGQVVNSLLHSHGAWSERRDRARKLAVRLPRSWMKDRSNELGPRLETVSQVVQKALDEHPGEAEARFLLGWIMRLLRSFERAEREAG